MNYNWLVKIILKSGKELETIYVGPEINSGEVATKYTAGGTMSMNGFFDKTKTHNILVLAGEIAALDISEWKG